MSCHGRLKHLDQLVDAGMPPCPPSSNRQTLCCPLQISLYLRKSSHIRCRLIAQGGKEQPEPGKTCSPVKDCLEICRAPPEVLQPFASLREEADMALRQRAETSPPCSAGDGHLHPPVPLPIPPAMQLSPTSWQRWKIQSMW